eukprot:CAMPEP_0176242518 /NCGR_PEP_ID=MMETSP0121_2-20121125/30445_1 /TAXON_ID=160619 /ORGANISM="Kryptoperidinium foliaceum, Strain CCMP 1326" /LENGTH=33 /DNA_ID= /DNA_START= /DNA_END= /DNA_ORIENTATION=
MPTQPSSEKPGARAQAVEAKQSAATARRENMLS